MTKKKPESYVAAFVYYAEGDEPLPTNPSIPLLLELMNELQLEETDNKNVVMQVVEDALVVGTEDGQRAGVILVHTVHKPEAKNGRQRNTNTRRGVQAGI